MSLKTNPYYINYQNGIGLAISDAMLAKICGTDEQHRLAEEFLKWLDNQINKRYTYENRKGKHRK